MRLSPLPPGMMAADMPTAFFIPTPADLLSKQGLALIVYFSLCAALLARLWLVRRGALNRLPDPVCAACGYIAANLPGTVCPECGGDLAAGGTVPPGWLRSTETLTHVVQWTIILPIAAFAITPLAWNFVRLREASQSVLLSARHDSCSAVIKTHGQGYRLPIRPRDIELEIWAFDGLMRLKSFDMAISIDPQTLEYQVVRSRASFSVPIKGHFDEAAVLALFGPRLSDPEGEEIKHETAALVGQIDAARKQVRWNPDPSDFEVTNRSGSQGDAPHDPLFLNIAAGFWTFVWAVGVFLILRRRRHRPEDAVFQPVPETLLGRWRHAPAPTSAAS
jgi:hypothetical protein